MRYTREQLESALAERARLKHANQIRINRNNARRLGAATYKGGCCGKVSHEGRRFTISGSCVECARLANKRARKRPALVRKMAVIVHEPYTPEQQAALDNGSGLKYYGRQCRFGHDGLRYTRNAACVHCARQQDRSALVGHVDDFIRIQLIRIALLA